MTLPARDASFDKAKMDGFLDASAQKALTDVELAKKEQRIKIAQLKLE
jgi:hypothetical protein